MTVAKPDPGVNSRRVREAGSRALFRESRKERGVHLSTHGSPVRLPYADSPLGPKKTGPAVAAKTEGEQMASVVHLQERIAVMMQGGAQLDQVESEVIDPCDLSSEQKAALWLYAWSFVEGGEQRDTARRYLQEVGLG